MNEARMWGGRFADDADPLLRRFNDSFHYDHLLLTEDLEGSIAWAKALRGARVLSETEERTIVRGLKEITLEEDEALDEYEDVHSYVEAKLTEAIGPLAKKLHTGRSRNDQVATDLRLWLKRASREAALLALELAGALAKRAEEEAATPMPGFTHLKQAEPVSFGHWSLAYVEMLLRDVDRFGTAIERGDECPLGSAALAGTPLSVDRAAVAEDLGFTRPTANSIDAVSSRDFAADYLFASSMLLTNLSRLSEDLIFLSSDEARYVELPDALATGSSRMPQKKNPDILELVRGHAARSIGEITGLLALMKGLPLSYNKDLQLDKEPLFRMRATLAMALPALTALFEGLSLDRDRMRAAASADLLLATTLMDAVASRGIPFREAHEIVSRRVGEAIARGTTLRDLGPGGGITSEDLRALSVDTAIAGKASLGGTAPSRVREAAKSATLRIGKLTETISGGGGS
jgi:argininosuccinate lyase / amino-acid N-acetyltransferase